MYPSLLTLLAVWELGVLAYSCLVLKMTWVWVAARINPGKLSFYVGNMERVLGSDSGPQSAAFFHLFTCPGSALLLREQCHSTF